MHLEKRSRHSNTLRFSIILRSDSAQRPKTQDNVSSYRVGREGYPFPAKSRIIFGRCSRVWHIKYTAQVWNNVVFYAKFGEHSSCGDGLCGGCDALGGGCETSTEMHWKDTVLCQTKSLSITWNLQA